MAATPLVDRTPIARKTNLMKVLALCAMSRRVAVEEVRIAVGNGVITGQWDLPGETIPPHPLAVIFPDRPGRDLDGGETQRPRLRPFLEMSRALLHAGIASFRFALPEQGVATAFVAAWTRAPRHILVSRQRIGLVIVGKDGWHAATPQLPAIRAVAEPLAAVVVAPGEDADLTPLDGIPTRVLSYDDLTEHLQASSDWIAGRAVPHPVLLDDVGNSLAEMLRPRWERATRPPGTAIGG